MPAGPEKIDLTEWLPDASRIDSDSIFEQVVSLERYGQVISLLWLL